MTVNTLMKAELVFHKEFEYYCFKNCYWQLLKSYGVERPELFLDCGVEWLFVQEEGAEENDYQFSTGDFFSSFLPSQVGHAHFHSLSDHGENVSRIWESNQRKLKEGVPLIVAADVYELDYTPFYHKKHSYHSLLLTGYEERTSHYQVIDWYPPWYFKGECSQAMMDAARSSSNEADGVLSGKPIQYLWVEVEKGPWTVPAKHLMDEALSLCLEQFYCIPSERQAEQRGIHALHALLAKIERMKDEAGDKRQSFLEDLHGKLFFTASRKTFLKFYLQSAAKEWPSSKLYECMVHLEETIKEWKKLSSMVIKAALSEKSELLQQVTDLFRGLILLEKQFYYKLYTLSKSLKVEGYPIWV